VAKFAKSGNVFCQPELSKTPVRSPTCPTRLPSKTSLGAVEPSLDFATVPESVAGKSRDGTSSDPKLPAYRIIWIVY